MLKRDRRICYICQQPGANEVDHIRPGDDHSLSNLAPVHGDPCHKAKTIRERPMRSFLPRKRPQEKHPGVI